MKETIFIMPTTHNFDLAKHLLSRRNLDHKARGGYLTIAISTDNSSILKLLKFMASVNLAGLPINATELAAKAYQTIYELENMQALAAYSCALLDTAECLSSTEYKELQNIIYHVRYKFNGELVMS